MKVLLGVTGSVAATLTKKMVEALHEAGHEVQVVATNQSQYFFSKKCLGVKVWTDGDEWPHASYEKGEDVLHIKLRDWADVLLIAPLTANTLAKVANGMSDNLLTGVVRAWNLRKAMIVAPAMNTMMWDNPFTSRHLETIREVYSTSVVNPVSKMLACGDEGVGAMASIHDIVEIVDTVNISAE